MKYIWLIPLLPALGAAVNGLVGIRVFSRRMAGLVACAAMVGALGISLVAFWQLLGLPAEARAYDVVVAEWIPSIPLMTAHGIGSFQVPWGFRLDPLSGMMILVVTGIGTLIHVYSTAYMADPLARAAEGELEVVLEDWSLRRGARDELRLVAADPERAFGFELALRPAKPLVLHGAGGYSQKGGAAGNASAYVSWTRLALEGTLVLDGAERNVHGAAWFDHEFGSSVLPEGTDGWDWFGLQLDQPDGRELMLFVLRDARGEPIEASAATLVERDGRARALGRADFTLIPGASGPETRWTSPKTGATYPARWTIVIPEAELRLELAPLVSDCELVSRTTAISYWEGPVAVTGSATGRGYAELTGYAGSLSGRF